MEWAMCQLIITFYMPSTMESNRPIRESACTVGALSLAHSILLYMWRSLIGCWQTHGNLWFTSRFLTMANDTTFHTFHTFHRNCVPVTNTHNPYKCYFFNSPSEPSTLTLFPTWDDFSGIKHSVTTAQLFVRYRRIVEYCSIIEHHTTKVPIRLCVHNSFRWYNSSSTYFHTVYDDPHHKHLV